MPFVVCLRVVTAAAAAAAAAAAGELVAEE